MKSEFKKGVTIIVPGHNCEDTLKRCFDSIIRQTFRPIQFLFVNDGSTDKTEEIARSYKNSFEKANIEFEYIGKQNGGQASAINSAIKLINKEYFMWFDSDDELLPDNIKEKVKILESKNLDFVICGVSIYKKNKIYNTFFPKIKKDIFKDIIFEESFLPGYGQGTILTRTANYFKKVKNEFIYESKEGQNWQLMLPICFNAKYEVIEKPLFNIYITKNSHSRRKRSFESEIQRRDNFTMLLEETIKNISLINEKDSKELVHYIHVKYLHEKCVISFNYWKKESFNNYYSSLEKPDKTLFKMNKIINCKLGFIYRLAKFFFKSTRAH